MLRDEKKKNFKKSEICRFRFLLKPFLYKHLKKNSSF